MSQSDKTSEGVQQIEQVAMSKGISGVENEAFVADDTGSHIKSKGERRLI